MADDPQSPAPNDPWADLEASLDEGPAGSGEHAAGDVLDFGLEGDPAPAVADQIPDAFAAGHGAAPLADVVPEEAAVPPLTVFPAAEDGAFEHDDEPEVSGTVDADADVAIADFLADSGSDATRLETAEAGAADADPFTAWNAAEPEAAPAAAGSFGVFGVDPAETTADAAAAADPDLPEGDHAEPAPAADFDFAAAGAAAAVAAGMAAQGGSAEAVPLNQGLGGKVIRRPRKKKGGVVGQLVGVVGGGLLAVPIVGGILLGRMWLGGPDTVGIAKVVPDVVLPQRFRRDGAAGALDGVFTSAQAPSDTVAEPGTGGLDALPSVPVPDAAAVTEPPSLETLAGTVEPGADRQPGDAVGTATAGDAPLTALATTDDPLPSIPAPPEGSPEPQPVPEPLVEPLAATGGRAASAGADPAPLSPVDPAPAPAAGDPQPTTPVGLDPRLGIDPSGPAPAPEPADDPSSTLPGEDAGNPPREPAAALDLAELDAAVSQAGAAIEAVAAVPPDTDRDDPERMQLLVDWYKSLAVVAEQAAALESDAADAGIAWPGSPEVLDRLHGDLAAHAPLAEDLKRLARDWLRFGNRGTAGVVLPVTLDGVRKVGPYWVATMSVTQADGSPGEVAVISRTEPAAIPGDRMIVTGLVFQDGVLWATDMRAAPAGF